MQTAIHSSAPMLLAAAAAGLAAGMLMSAGGPLDALLPVFTELGPLELPLAMFVLAVAARWAPNVATKSSLLPEGIAPTVPTGDEKNDFITVFNALNSELLDGIDKYSLPARTRDYMRRMIDYNVPHGKLTRGLTVVSTLRSLRGGGPISPADHRRAAVLGWAVEWLQAMFLVMDDIMDASETRRGQKCWYLQEDVKLNAINDGLLLEAHIYVMLKKCALLPESYMPPVALTPFAIGPDA